MPAAINSIGLAEIFDCFFAIEENELSFLSELGLQGQHSRHLQKQTGARTAIVRANKAKTVEDFCVVVRAEEKRRLRAPTKTRDQIYKCHRTTRSVVGKLLLGHFPADGLKLFFNVSACSNDCV